VTGFTVSVLPEAEADIREAYLWYRERSQLAADGFRSEVFEAIDDLKRTRQKTAGGSAVSNDLLSGPLVRTIAA
jgi:hypothetical protein